jgi:hypothetical protein
MNYTMTCLSLDATDAIAVTGFRARALSREVAPVGARWTTLADPQGIEFDSSAADGWA